ncbi:hypothetical protein BGZ95_004351 [Linnemannia exigua]|uniref:Uncharacterized protein n=1 Tax=Linnemannia exigua TaxID=604196 RepID=A0AAD4D3L3_9FUNG|nr:hypothetical protein BGZ95_004351 [Linnemannia exigua]
MLREVNGTSIASTIFPPHFVSTAEDNLKVLILDRPTALQPTLTPDAPLTTPIGNIPGNVGGIQSDAAQGRQREPAMVPDAALGPCFASSWRRVMEGYIRYCFAKVLVLNRGQMYSLKDLRVEFDPDHMGRLREEIIKCEHLDKDVIAAESDISLLNYLDTLWSNGPNEETIEAFRKIENMVQFKSMHLHFNEDNISEDDEENEENEDDEEDSDPVYPSDGLTFGAFPIDDSGSTLLLLSSNVYSHDPEQQSPLSGFTDEEYSTCIEVTFIETLDEFRNAAMALHLT